MTHPRKKAVKGVMHCEMDSHWHLLLSGLVHTRYKDCSTPHAQDGISSRQMHANSSKLLWSMKTWHCHCHQNKFVSHPPSCQTKNPRDNLFIITWSPKASSGESFADLLYACSDNCFSTRRPRRPCRKESAKPNFPRRISASCLHNSPACKVEAINACKSWILCSVLRTASTLSPELAKSNCTPRALQTVPNAVAFLPSMSNLHPVNMKTSSMEFFADSTLPGNDARM